ncbi:MAG TPA: GNAT family N-acetyltransferase [Candidatus Binataceae bacterium]|nr:GNAT family N-acetyltransferase [Candidatus Binataceae bacterium]
MKSTDLEITLVPVDRENYRALFRMQLKPGQEFFVTPPRWTLARCYVRMFGDNFEHLPHLIRAAGAVVGYATTVCDPASADDYWIDDIMIDAAHQGKGYGRAAMRETIAMIARRYPRCRAVQLTCFRQNTNAETLYRSLGFEPTGGVDPEFSEPNYILRNAALDAFRR